MLSKIKSFFYNLWHWKKYLAAKKYEKLLIKGLINKEAEKIKLIREASAMIPKKARKGKSEYIPMSYVSRIRIKTMILKDYGYKMRLLGIRITDELKFV